MEYARAAFARNEAFKSLEVLSQRVTSREVGELAVDSATHLVSSKEL
jgi:hypothetical protein